MSHKSLSYREAHRSVTATIPTDEYAKLKVIADAAGIAPSAYATRVLREAIAQKEAAQ